MIDFASDFMECAKSIKTDGWENYFDRVLNFDKNHKLGEISRRAKELEEMPAAKEQPSDFGEVALNDDINFRAANLENSTVPATKSRAANLRVDLFEPTATPQSEFM